METNRCPWTSTNKLLIDYHDQEWGVPVIDDRKLFEFILLDSFQAGLSWSIILNKRDGFRKAFDNFEFTKIASYDNNRFEELIQNEGIIRNKLKIKATITNAQSAISLIEKYGSLSNFVWQFTDGKTIINSWSELSEIPTTSNESDKMSAEFKKHGFKFIGSTICYSFMQAAGMINDHLTKCFRYDEINAIALK